MSKFSMEKQKFQKKYLNKMLEAANQYYLIEIVLTYPNYKNSSEFSW